MVNFCLILCLVTRGYFRWKLVYNMVAFHALVRGAYPVTTMCDCAVDPRGAGQHTGVLGDPMNIYSRRNEYRVRLAGHAAGG